jgi:hypothetical protein
MDVDTPDPTSVLNHGLTIVNIVALILVLGYQVIMEYMRSRSKRHEDNKLDKLITATMDFTTAVREQSIAADAYRDNAHNFMNDVTGTMSGIRKMMADLISRNSGMMNKDNSLRLIEQSFPNVIRDIVTIFADSLATNGYATRKDFIRTRVKTLIGQVLDNVRSSLSYFQMSIDVDLFFPTDPHETSVVRYTLANELWDIVEPLYLQDRPIAERLEEMRLTVPNLIGDYLARIKSDLRDDVRG